MLKGIDPLLSGELLQILDTMGHGDVLAIVDRNFPAYASGLPVVRVSSPIVPVIEAVLSLLPLDTFIEQPLGRMGPQDSPADENEVQLRVLRSAIAAEKRELTFEPIRRFDFYDRARDAFAVVQTLETAPYCDFLLTKGVI
jgi:L-fucose mutarotase